MKEVTRRPTHYRDTSRIPPSLPVLGTDATRPDIEEVFGTREGPTVRGPGPGSGGTGVANRFRRCRYRGTWSALCVDTLTATAVQPLPPTPLHPRSPDTYGEPQLQRKQEERHPLNIRRPSLAAELTRLKLGVGDASFFGETTGLISGQRPTPLSVAERATPLVWWPRTKPRTGGRH